MTSVAPASDWSAAIAIIGGSAAASAALIVLLKPLLIRYALARPNARSSHTLPTPQGGGIAIAAVVLAMIAGGYAAGLDGFSAPWAAALFGTVLALGLAGAIDDIRPLPVLPRLLVQFGAAFALLATLPIEGRILPFLPALLEIMLLAVGLVWFINLTNFMDGIDWITVVEMVPITAAIALFGMLGLVPQLHFLLPLALALLGALVGFAPFNRHVARLFLGDVGSLPIGAIIGWMLILLALTGEWAAALILPLYHLADASITLVRRVLNGENISQAHRSHFYQRAVQGGFTVPQVTGRVFVLNVVLGLLAALSLRTENLSHQLAIVALAGLAVVAVLNTFNRGKR